MSRTRILTAFCATLVLWLCLCTPALAGNIGRYLPDPLNLRNRTEEAYGANLTEFTQEVSCGKFGEIGEIRFTYNTWTGDYDPAGPGWDTGGGGLAGGFWLTDTECMLRDGWEWGWVQTVKATVPLTAVWGASPNNWYPDTRHKLDPNYAGDFLPSLDPAPNPMPTLGFQDFPSRFPSAGDQSWLAELGLVCKNTKTREVSVLGTFWWGFGVKKSPAAITATKPYGWGGATTTFLAVLSDHFNGKEGSVKWTFNKECCCVPLPGSVWMGLGLLGALGAVRHMRRRRAA